MSCGLTMVLRRDGPTASPWRAWPASATVRMDASCSARSCHVVRQPSEAAWGGAGGLWVLQRALVLIVLMVSQGCANVRTFQIVHYKLCNLLYIKNISIKMQK